MALRSVKWTSKTRLECAGCPDNEVVLCVDSSLVAAKDCPEYGEAPSPFVYSTIEATISSYCCISKSSKLWAYTFLYDDAQLVEGATVTSADISGAFCKGCLTQWVEELVGDESYIRDDGDGIYTFVSPHGCEYQFEAGAGGCDYPLDFIFGDGPDGDLVVSNPDSILPPPGRNYYFDNLTIDAGASFSPLGSSTGDDEPEQFFQIFVSGTLTINGALQVDGADGDNGGSGSPGADGGLLDVAGSYTYFPLDGPGGGYGAGGNGGRGTSGVGASQAGKVEENSNTSSREAGGGYMGGGPGGNGGAGGDGSAAGVSPGYSGFFRIRSLVFDLVGFSSGGSFIASAIGGGSGGTGGGGGGRTGSAVGGAGGGGGSSGGSIWIAARNVVINPGGRISANGGNGGDGGDGVAGGGGDTAGGGGAGGGGGGGLIYLLYETLTNNGSIEVNGGTGGTGGAPIGAGTVGADGGDGEDGNIYLLNMRDGVFS